MRSGFLQNDTAVSPILGAILILAISTAIITNIQINFVPVWNTQEDLNHLEKMNDDFRQLKSSIEEGVSLGTPLASPLSMGFKYTPKIIAYNPKESASATLSIQKDMWAEVRYNEVLPEGMNDSTTVKNISTATITYSLLGTQNLSYFIYEYGLLRRSGSNYTSSAQTFLVNGSLYLLSVNATEPETTSGVERRVVNIYPTSQAKNSVIGKNVWLTMHTRYVDWWTDPDNPASLQNQGATIKKTDNASGIIVAYFNSIAVRMGETQVTSSSKKPPSRLSPARLVKITPQNTMLPVMGTNNFQVEVQDFYNNPVPNVLVNFSVNRTGKPNNAYANATLLQTSAISGADGRANIQVRTNGSGIYFIDAVFSGYTTTFTYPASSQGAFISLAYTGSEPSYPVTATLTDGFGNPGGGTIYFSTSEGTVTPSQQTADGNGNAATTLDTSTATGLKLTNIQTDNVTNNSARITWDTTNTVTLAANRTGGVVFNSIDIPTSVSGNGCVRYGTTPGNYPNINCGTFGSSHTVTLTSLLPYTAYFFIVNSSRAGGASVNSTEYMFVTESAPSETIPPASITGLNNVTYEPLFINWAWTDPADADFKEVQVYIDGTYKTTVSKGVQSYSASYFMPNSMHTISTHTVDISNNVNTTWVNNTANTSTMFTYVFDFLNTIGAVTNFVNAQNGTDGGDYATFAEEQVGGVSRSNRTMYPAKTIANGTQSGIYTPGNLDAVDGSIDITTLLASATLHANANPVMSIGTITGGSYLNSITSDNAYLELRENNAAQLDSRWNSWERFTNASNTSLVEMDIGIEAYVADGEAVYVQLWDYPNNNWNTTWHQLGTTGLPTTDTNAVFWYNITNAAEIQRFVNSTGDYSIRFADAEVATGAPDTVRSRFEIDELKVKFTYFADTLDVTYTFTETNSSASWQNISIQDSSYGDALANASIFNIVSGQWESVMTSAFTGGTTPVTHVNTVVGTSGNASNYDAGGGQIKFRYNWTGATQNNTLGVDLINVTVFYATGGVFHLNVTTNTTGIPDTSTHVLQLRYNVSNDNFTLQTWNGSAWNNRTTLNDTVLSYRNITLQPAELLSDWTMAGNAATINKYYIRVRYLDLNQGALQGKLYLDYQRVYSS